jgi:hypothetical protein
MPPVLKPIACNLQIHFCLPGADAEKAKRRRRQSRPTFGNRSKSRKNGRSARRSRCGHRLDGDEAFSLGTLAGQLAGAANGLSLFAGALFGRLLVMAAHLHFTEDAFTLQFLFQSAESLINIVVTNEYLHERHSLSKERILQWLSGNTIPRRGGLPSQAGG